MNQRTRGLLRAAAAAVGFILFSVASRAQDLEPGSYQNAPVDVNAIFLSYGYSTGNVLVEATLPIEGATATVQGASVGYLRTFGLLGRSAKVDGAAVVSHANFSGFVDGEFRTRTPSGFTDPRVRLSVNLIGSPALDLPSFARFRQRTIVGVSLQVALPLGQYDENRLINLGANRFSFRPEVGLSQAVGHWVIEAAAGAWTFTRNSDNFGGSTLDQRPLYFAKGGAMYVFRRNLWLAGQFGYADGGATLVNDVPKDTIQTNKRVGVMAAVPLTRSTGLRIVYTGGLSTRFGADFDSIGIGYQYSWGGKMPPRKPSP